MTFFSMQSQWMGRWSFQAYIKKRSKKQSRHIKSGPDDLCAIFHFIQRLWVRNGLKFFAETGSVSQWVISRTESVQYVFESINRIRFYKPNQLFIKQFWLKRTFHSQILHVFYCHEGFQREFHQVTILHNNTLHSSPNFEIAYKRATSRVQLMKEHHAGLEHEDEQMTAIFFCFYFIISIFWI